MNNNASLNERINLRGLLESFGKYAVQDFQKAQDKAIYNRRVFSPKNVRTGYLRRTWSRSVSVGFINKLQFKNPLYGVFVDMGVSKGVSYGEQQYSRSRYGRRIGDGARVRPRKWIGKTKTYSQYRLSELLVARYGAELVNTVRNLLGAHT